MLYVSMELGEESFHDSAGDVIMPATVFPPFGEIWLLDGIVPPELPCHKNRQSRGPNRAASFSKDFVSEHSRAVVVIDYSGSGRRIGYPSRRNAL